MTSNRKRTMFDFFEKSKKTKTADNKGGESQEPSSSTGAQWLSGRVLDSRPKGRRFEPHRHHCVVVLEQDTFILA